MTRALRIVGAVAALAAAFAGQAALAGPLGHANAVRSSRQLQMVPSSIGFRLAAAGVRPAAADAFWLTVLTRMNREWPDPAAKARWLARATELMVDMEPRARTYSLYPIGFIDRIDRNLGDVDLVPEIERLVGKAIDAEVRRPFQESWRPNADDWELPHEIGMVHYLRFAVDHANEHLEPSLLWLKQAAAKPACPLLIVEFVSQIERERGDPLAGWKLFRHRRETARERGAGPALLEFYANEMDKQRLKTLREWARLHERDRGSWPTEAGEVLAQAPDVVRTAFAEDADLLAAWFGDVVLHPETRDIELPSVTAQSLEEGRHLLTLLAETYEREHGRRPETLADLESLGRTLPRPPLHGTRWSVGDEPGTFEVVDDPDDPRLAAPADAPRSPTGF